MKKLYIANTDFEFELENAAYSWKQSFHNNPICLQLQFIPLLFANPDDEVLVSHLPDEHYVLNLQKKGFALPKIVVTADCGEIQSWGWSNGIKKWAFEKNIAYPMPSWEIVKKVNSKEWSFHNTPKLEGAALIRNEKELKSWIENQKGKQFVGKKCFGFSGRGHFHFSEFTPILLHFCENEWKKGNPVIMEPWVERLLDFSTQWEIGVEGVRYLGVTRLLNTSLGSYLGTAIEDGNYPFLQEHLIEANKILELARKEGYIGYAGVDAMVYKKENELLLQPVVEVNARMTMALCALFIKQKYFQKEKILLEYGKNREGLLPSCLKIDGKTVTFSRQLQVKL